MAVRRSVTISGPAGRRLFGGRLAPAELSGAVAAGDAVATGALGVAAPPPAPSGPVSWNFSAGAPVPFARNTTTTLATSVPAGATVSASPDLLPGQTLTLASGTLTAVGDATVPTVDGSTPGSALDLISARDVVIEVLESTEQHAVAQNMRTGTMYGRGAAGARVRIQTAIAEAQDGDTIQVSPGGVWIPGNSDGSGYLESGMLHVYKSLTLTNVPGRGRWSLAPPSVTANTGWSGLVIREPSQTYSDSGDTNTSNPRKTIVVEGFDFSNWGQNADDNAIKIRANGSPTGWDYCHASVTFRNFKIGKAPYLRGANGILGSAETLVLEDGHVFDCGGGIGGIEGNEHNLYITARYMTIRGVRSSRSRANSADGLTLMDGHLAKLTFANATIEGSVFDMGPLADASLNIQCKGGGNLVLRGCLLIGGPLARTATGNLAYVREMGNDGGFAFNSEGCSLLVEKNVFISHRVADTRALVYFAPSTGFGSGQYLDQALITSCVIRDNIGMNVVPNTGTNWVRNAPASFADGTWGVSNSAMPYGGLDEVGFVGRALKQYLREYGPIAAGAGSVATRRFLWPHGSMARNDSHRGLG